MREINSNRLERKLERGSHSNMLDKGWDSNKIYWMQV